MAEARRTYDKDSKSDSEALGTLVLMVAMTAGPSSARRAGRRRAIGDARRGPGRQVQATRGERADTLSRYMDREMPKGNLRLAHVQSEGSMGPSSTSATMSSPRASRSGGPRSSATA